jgi:hypothetical protein
MGATVNFRLRFEQTRQIIDEIKGRGLPALAMGNSSFTETNEGDGELRKHVNDAWQTRRTWPGLDVDAAPRAVP